jgi:3-isopropylmalate/(R)-2-methylmalate dehydratase small subunit
MALKKITEVAGTAVAVPGDDVDTDRIIPARFMKCVTFDGLGQYLFFDERFEDATGRVKSHPLNDSRFDGATILIGGRNFGCGSSREHAPQAIYRYGFRAVVAESFAEIFHGNSTTLGIPCVTASRDDLRSIRESIESQPKQEVVIDLIGETIRTNAATFPIRVNPSARDALIHGRWDAIGELLEASGLVSQRVGELPYMTPLAA